jgi:hypothetical protein
VGVQGLRRRKKRMRRRLTSRAASRRSCRAATPPRSPSSRYGQPAPKGYLTGPAQLVRGTENPYLQCARAIHVDLAYATLVCGLQVLSQLSTDLGKDLSDKKALIKELVTKVLTEAS